MTIPTTTIQLPPCQTSTDLGRKISHLQSGFLSGVTLQMVDQRSLEMLALNFATGTSAYKKLARSLI